MREGLPCGEMEREKSIVRLGGKALEEEEMDGVGWFVPMMDGAVEDSGVRTRTEGFGLDEEVGGWVSVSGVKWGLRRVLVE